jgi:hypothetical protein
MRAFGLVFLCTPLLLAQITSSSISGYVLDPSKKSIPHAVVNLISYDAHIQRSTEADAEGFYSFRQLPGGSYSLSAKAKSFGESKNTSIRLSVDTPQRVDLKMPLAAESSNLDIRGPSLLTESSDLGAVIGRSQVEALPLNGRDFLQLSLLVPGVVPPVEDSELSSRGSFAMHANGAREEFNNFLLDGVDNNDPNINRYNLQPPVDAIQEFKIATNSYSAEYGRSAGGQVNVVTRSGSNALRGFAYDYLRNRIFDARNAFSNPKPHFVRNQFGGGLGGPLRRNKTFFFANADLFRERAGETRIGSVPVEAIRQGDVSSLGVAVVDPFTRQPFAGARVPTSRIHPLASRVFGLFPQANLAGGTGNYLAQPVAVSDQNQFNSRLDHYIGATDILTLRYSTGTNHLDEPFAEDSTGVPGFGDRIRDRGHNALVQYQRVVRPNIVNVLLLGFNRLNRSVLPENFDKDVNQLWGVNWLPRKPVDFGYPSITVAGFSRVGDVTPIPIVRAANTYQLQDSLSIVRGSHGLKMGVEARRIQHNGINDLLVRGSMTFSGALSGTGASDLLLGLLSFGVQGQSDAVQTLRSTATNLYFQDDWKLRPSLTLNLGVRYEYNTPPTDPTNRMTVLNLATGALSQVGTNGVSRSGTRPDRNNIAPRVGLAWASRDGRSVARAGYGFFYDSGLMVANTSLYFNPPYFNIRVFFPTATSLISLSDPFPARGGITPAASLSSLSPDLTQGSLQHWNINLQRDISWLGIVSAAYAGSKGTHLLRSRDLNQPAPGAGDVAARRPFRAFSNIFWIESGGNSSFQSLQLSVNRPLRFVSSRFSLLSAYTYSKSIDDTSAFLATKADKNFPQDSRNYGAERAASSFDIRQRLSVAAVWLTMPWGLQSSLIFSANSGQPFTPILRFDNSNTGNTGGTYGNDRPNVVGNVGAGPRTVDRWFNTAAFAVPSRFTFGNAGRNILRGPGYASTDIAVSRKFALRGDRLVLQAEAQAFNLFNRVNYNLPEAFVDEPATFGRIFSARSPRQLQFALRLMF